MPTQYRANPAPPPIGAGGVIPLDPVTRKPVKAAAAPAADDGNNPLIPDAIEKPAGAIGDVADAAAKAGAWASDRNNWIRVAKVVVGGALILVGLAKLAAPAAGAVTGAAADVLPVGKIAKKVGAK